jgi:hypothetical protein
MNLLSKGTSNAKTVKNALPTYILYLAPYKTNSMGINICPKATKGCSDSCLFTAGMGSFHSVQKARMAKTEFYLKDKKGFSYQLLSELKKISSMGVKTAIRLNGTSDLDFVSIIKTQTGEDILSLPNLIFYDYTKILGKALKYRDCKNYFITFSRSETNDHEVIKALDSGLNVSVVFNHKLKIPKTYMGYRVVDGDTSDDQMIKLKSTVLALRAKGKARKDKTGFVINTGV